MDERVFAPSVHAAFPGLLDRPFTAGYAADFEFSARFQRASPKALDVMLKQVHT